MSRTNTTVPAPAAKELSGRPASVAPAESAGSSSAVAASRSSTIASNSRSTAREESEAGNGTCASFVNAYALAISPARAGMTLFTIIPTAYREDRCCADHRHPEQQWIGLREAVRYITRRDAVKRPVD